VFAKFQFSPVKPKLAGHESLRDLDRQMQRVAELIEDQQRCHNLKTRQ